MGNCLNIRCTACWMSSAPDCPWSSSASASPRHTSLFSFVSMSATVSAPSGTCFCVPADIPPYPDHPYHAGPCAYPPDCTVVTCVSLLTLMR